MNHIRPHLSPEQESAVSSLLDKIAAGDSAGGGRNLGTASGAGTGVGRPLSQGVSASGRGTGPGSGSGGGDVDTSKRAQHYQRALQASVMTALLPAEEFVK